MKVIILATVVAISATAQAEVKLNCPPDTVQIREQYQGGGESFFCVKKNSDGNTVKHGPAVGFKSAGVKGYEANFTNGLKDGEFKLFHENGQMKEVAQLKAGKYVGKTTWYWESGRKKADGQYVDDTESGTWSFFDDKGKRVAQGSFKEAVATFKQLHAEKEKRTAEIKQNALVQGAPCAEWIAYQQEDAYAREIASQAEASGQDPLAAFPDLESKRTVAKVKLEYEAARFERKTKMKFDPAWCQ